MASVSGSCNAVNGNSSASQDKTGSMPAIFQGLAICLKDPDKKYQDKVCALLSAWERLASFSTSSLADDIRCVTEYLYRDTLLLVLRGEWTKLPTAVKTHLSVTLQRTAAALGNVEALRLCQNVSRLVKNPWDDPILSKIIQGSGPIEDLEALEFCIAETPSLLCMRLEMLCDSKCEDLALKLLAICRKCLQDPDKRFVESCTVSQQEYWQDLHIALLFRFKKSDEVISQLKQLSLEDGHNLVQRFINKGTNSTGYNCSSRVWRSSLKIAELASQCFLATALFRCPPPACLSALTVQMVRLQKQLGKSNQALVNMLQTLVHHSDLITSAHMYILCATLSKEFADDLKPLCIELYVRAAAVDVNDLEERKLKGDSEGVRQAEVALAATFSALADLVKANVRVCRECVLTAFSLHPTQQRFDRLMELASYSSEESSNGSEILPPNADYSVSTTDYIPSVNEHSLTPVVGEPPPGSGGGPGGGCFHSPFTIVKEVVEDADSGVDLSDGINGIGEQDLDSSISRKEDIVNNSPYTCSAASSLGISKQIMDDLAVVLHSCRWEVLSWNSGWNELRPLCQRYLLDQDRMRSVTKELKYLNIDYSQFDHIPRVERDEFYGIEKGYENYVVMSSDDEQKVVTDSSTDRRRRSNFTKRPSYSRSESSESEEVCERKNKVLRKKVLKRISLSTRASSDSDSNFGPPRTRVKNTKRESNIPSSILKAEKGNALPITRDSSQLVKALRMFRPDVCPSFNGMIHPYSPTSTIRSPTCEASALSNNVQLSRCSSVTSSDHFAPMLSTLNMNPKIVLTRTPVSNSTTSPLKKNTVSPKITCSDKIYYNAPNVLRPHVLLDKLDKLQHRGLQRTMASLKGLDMLQVRPPPTAVHMVQLPNPPTNSHIVTANGLTNSSTNNNSGNTNSDSREQQAQQDEAGKATGSTSSTAEDAVGFNSTSNVEIPPTATSTTNNEDGQESVTLVSTPSVSIFQVAHRPTGNSNTVLQPVTAVTGFSHPVPNPRAKTPNSSGGGRGSRPRVAIRPPTETEGTQPNQTGNVGLSQLLTQSPNVDTTELTSSSQLQNLLSTLNGPLQSTQPRPQIIPSARHVEPGRVARQTRREAQAVDSGTVNTSSTAVDSTSCRVPLVKYVDLDMVSSPTRPRPNSTTGVRRQSQGSNSSSPDPHQNRNVPVKNRITQPNPSSPALNSPQSPALQAPPSPLPIRKQHYVYRQDGKVFVGTEGQKGTSDNRLSSPSHPSQCSSPFSRPSSRSQDTSPSPSELLGAMYPPSFLPYPSSETGVIGGVAPTNRLSNFGGTSPSQSPSSSCLPALPKFQQAFGRKSHFDILPALGGLNVAPNSITNSAGLTAINPLQDPLLQNARIPLNPVASAPPLTGTNFGDNNRRFSSEQPNPPAEDEGLGSKLQSLLESALNGQISRSPTRNLTTQNQQLIVTGNELLLSSTDNPGSPLVSIDPSNASDIGATSALNVLLSEQLREFESVFERVASTSQLKEQLPWGELTQPDDGSYMVGPVEYLAPPSNFSGSMDASAASPNSGLAASPSSDDPTLSSLRSEVGSLEPEAPLMRLLTVASAARQALEEEEKSSCQSTSQAPGSDSSNIETIKQETEEEDQQLVQTQQQSEQTQQSRPLTSVIVATHDKQRPTRMVVLPAILTGTVVTTASETVQPVITTTSSTATSTTVTKTDTPKPNRTKHGTKSSPAVSPGASSGSPSKAATTAATVQPKAPQKAHDDEQTVLRVNAILEEYREQLRNSPDLQNKPAPRRRSNPLPSPSATPKRRKSAQSKAKLLSQHTRPIELSDNVVVSSSESLPSGTTDVSAPDNNNLKTEPVKVEPVVSTPTPTPVQVLSSTSGLHLSIPVSAVVSRTTSADGTNLTTAASVTAGTTSVAVTSTSQTTIASPATLPIAMQQLLVTSQAGMRQVLLPVSISGAGLRQALVGARGAATRFISVRQVTVGGTPGFISLPARLAAPITVRTVTGSQPELQSVVTSAAPSAVTAATGEANATETRVLVQELLTTQTQPAVQRTVSNTPATVHWTPAGATTDQPLASDVTLSGSTTAVATTPKVETGVLRFVPTVNRVSLPVPPGVDAVTLLAAAAATANHPAIPGKLSQPSAVEADSSWANKETSDSRSNSVDDPSTPVPSSSEDKLLNDAGVSEFLPCADFMGPGVSPSPCFSFSDSPLGSQNSSPATSPATFQASSAEEDSTSLTAIGEGLQSSAKPKCKILKRSEKPRWVLVRNDHGGMEYRRVSDVDGPTVIRTVSNKRNFGKKMLSKNTAQKVNSNTTVQTPSPTPSQQNVVNNSPATQDNELSTAGDVPVVKEEINSPLSDVGTKLYDIKSEVKEMEEIVGTTPESTVEPVQEIIFMELPNSPNVKCEPDFEEQLKTEGVLCRSPSFIEGDTLLKNVRNVRPRRCLRLQKEETSAKNETDAESVLDTTGTSVHSPTLEKGSSKTKRRSSTRGHVKKNCPCCIGTNEQRKRTKSETSTGEGPTAVEPISPAKKTTVITVAKNDVPQGNNKQKSKKNAQRKR